MPVVTCAALASTLKAATVALAIAVTGACPAYLPISAVRPGTVLDFKAATPVRLAVNGVTGVTIKNYASKNAQFIALGLTNSSNVVLDGVSCDGTTGACMTIGADDHVEIKNWSVRRTQGDGIDVAGSTNLNIHDGSCRGNIATAIHPDCVQMWSLQNRPVQHVVVQRVNVYGATQGIDNNASIWGDAGETDIKIMDNTLAVTASNCIALVSVTKAVVTGNRCATLPGAQWAAVVKVFCPTAAAPRGLCLDAIVSGNVNGGPPPPVSSVEPRKAAQTPVAG